MIIDGQCPANLIPVHDHQNYSINDGTNHNVDEADKNGQDSRMASIAVEQSQPELIKPIYNYSSSYK